MGSNASAFQAVSAESLGLGTAAFEDIGTSGATVPLNNGNITRQGTLTQQADFSLSGADIVLNGNQLYLGNTSQEIIQRNGVFAGVSLKANGTNSLEAIVASVYGTNDMLFQGIGVAGGYTVLEQAGGSDGLVLGTEDSVPILVRPARGASVTDFTTAGTRIGTGDGAGATRIAKLRTEKATMAAGTTGSIADTPVAASSIILVTPEFAPAGRLYYTISAGVGFTILSTDAGDAGSVSWQRITL